MSQANLPEIAEKLQGLMGQIDEIKKVAAPITPTAQKDSSLAHSLDETDSLRLANLVLKDQIERLRKEYEKVRGELADVNLGYERNEFKVKLAHKFNIDLAANDITVDADNNTLSISPRK